MKRPHVIVIGAGPGGLTAAQHLAASELVVVTLIQRDATASYLPGISPVLLGLRPAAHHQHTVDLDQVTVRAGEVIGLEPGRVSLADGTSLAADAIIAAPGLTTDATAVPAGERSFAVWEVDYAAKAFPAAQALTSGRLVIAIAGLPYRCPPAPYGLAMALKAQLTRDGRDVEVIVASPETRPLQALGERASAFIEELAQASAVRLQMGFALDRVASRDGLVVAADGQKLPYDLGLFVPPHRRPTFLAGLPGAGPLVSVDAYQRSAMDTVWVVGDVADTPLPRAAGVAEAQGHTAAENVLASLGLCEAAAPVLPSPSCYVWTTPTAAARIQVRFPNGMPPAGTPELTLDPPSAPLLVEALSARERWAQQLR